MVYEWIPYAAAASVLGSVPFGKIIARRVAGVDITRHGSGNIGATNVARKLGLKWGLLTLVLDALKGFVPVFIYAFCISQAEPGNNVAPLAIGLCSVLGHQFSIFQGLRGGKGVATALGVYLGISPSTRLACLVGLFLFILIVHRWRFISLGSVVSALAMPLLLALFGESEVVVFGSLIVAGLICLKHRENFQRLIKGEERKWRDENGQARRSRSLSNSSSE
ncbi:MAG: glycerol-3-phosphate 1-O-acyltransferase PlsY [Thermodesulfobacteriota bacterium]|nr:glycerol-3-phosphate 1-O-acyltransferase PlsY [Thermodesulfobacteriota bacterium]